MRENISYQNLDLTLKSTRIKMGKEPTLKYKRNIAKENSVEKDMSPSSTSDLVEMGGDKK